MMHSHVLVDTDTHVEARAEFLSIFPQAGVTGLYSHLQLLNFFKINYFIKALGNK